MEHFGEHLMIDGYGGSEAKLNDPAIVMRCVRELPDILEMHILTEPVLKEAPDNHIKDPGGWSAFVMIAESHISVHTFPKRGFVSIDIYTCRNGLDQELIKKYFADAFDLAELEVNFVIRGKRYPEHNIYV